MTAPAGYWSNKDPMGVLKSVGDFAVNLIKSEDGAQICSGEYLLINERKLFEQESEIERLREENEHLRVTIRKLRLDLLGTVLDAGIPQSIDPPGDFGDYPFSEN